MFGAIAAAGGERLIYAQADGNVVTFDLETGEVAGQFARFPLGPEEVHVSTCAVDRGTILLGDTRNGCVRGFRADGLQLRRYGHLTTPGIENQDELGVLGNPCAIEPVEGELLVACGGHDVEFGVQRISDHVDHLPHPEGAWRRAHGLTRVGDEIWVAETESGSIHRFHRDGRHIGRAPLPDELTLPFRLAFDGYEGVLAIFAPETESAQDERGIARLSLEGEFESWAVDAGEDGGKVYCPFDVAVLTDGRFVVADLPLGKPPDVRLQLFSADGRLLRTVIEDLMDLNEALRAWFDRLLEEGSAYERARVRHLYSGGSEEHLRKARELYAAALQEDPDHLLARLHRARLLEPEEAEGEYRIAVEHGADEGDAAARIAECREARGDLDGAIEVLREAVESDHPPEEYHRWVEVLGTWYLRRAGAADL